MKKEVLMMKHETPEVGGSIRQEINYRKMTASRARKARIEIFAAECAENGGECFFCRFCSICPKSDFREVK